VRQRLGAQNVRVERADALQWLARAAPRSVDLVFLDPPFDSALLAPALAAAAPIVVDGGFVYVEGSAAVEADAAAALGLASHRDGRAGAVHFHLLRKATPG
jgi:16S rRNA G966 N2-methylase RsmD